ncbi:MAG: glycosyltransferase family 4 protein [Acidobacteriota bacterium]
MKIVIMSTVIIPRDAIGHDVTRLYSLLDGPHEPVLYGDLVEFDALRRVDRPQVELLLADPSTIAIYHHSIHWPDGEALIDAARARVVFRFHNITPPRFFAPHDVDYTRCCQEGRDQTRRLMHRHPEALWLADSTFNIEEGGLAGLSHVEVVPPFNNADAWRSIAPDAEVLQSLAARGGVHLLFVGRMAPNKGHRFLLDVVSDYRRHYDEPVTLHVTGRRDVRLESYNSEMDRLVVERGLQDSVHWVDSLSDAQLLAYFTGCDMYVSCSEHEGFCVPVVEAQSLGLPVMARDCGAVAETLAAEQLLLGDDPADYSAALRVLWLNPSYREYLGAAGKRNYTRRFTETVIAGHLAEAVATHLGEDLW